VGDLTMEGYRWEFEEAKGYFDQLECPNIIYAMGNHDAKNVGYRHFEEFFGIRESSARISVPEGEAKVVALDSTKPDLDEGEIGREHYGWIEEGFAGESDLRVFVCHHHLMPVPGTGRERNQVLDAGDVLALLRRCGVDLVLSGHRHVPYVWPLAGMLLVHSGTAATLRTRGFPQPAYNLLRIEGGRISVELCVPGGDRWSLGDYPRDWPAELTAREIDPFVRPPRSVSLADDEPTAS
jgi:3',5'-cyclic-AMP phosphodiesterase